jgi:hypothetical protein
MIDAIVGIVERSDNRVVRVPEFVEAVVAGSLFDFRLSEQDMLLHYLISPIHASKGK